MKNLSKHWLQLAFASYILLVSLFFAYVSYPKYWEYWASGIFISTGWIVILIWNPGWLVTLTNYFIIPVATQVGNSMNYLGLTYYREPKVECNIGDKVIIHPILGKSQATKPYPAMVAALQVKGKDGFAEGNIWVLAVVGIEDNKEWKGAWINDYLFGRLEFVSRNYKIR